MNDYRQIVSRYVQKIGQTQAVGLGDSAEFTSVDKDRLASELKDQYAKNQQLIWIVCGLWVILFFLGVYFAVHYRDNLTGLSVALGGNIMVLSGVMFALRRLWLDSSAMGALLAILPGLGPAEAAKVITSFYFNVVESKGQRAELVQSQTPAQPQRPSGP
jgi:hypothetical protein